MSEYNVLTDALAVFEELTADPDEAQVAISQRAIEHATYYWLGYLTATLGHPPLPTELRQRVRETWRTFA